MKIFSNFRNLSDFAPAHHHTYFSGNSSFLELLGVCWRARHADALVLNNHERRLFWVCLISFIPWPRKYRIVSVDLLLRPAKSLPQKILAPFKVLLLRRVDLFILYFKNTGGYTREFKISPDKMVYVPFKVNSWQSLRAKRDFLTEGNYVLLAGETLRDHQTFCEAVRKTNLPALIVLPPSAQNSVEARDWFQNPPESLKIEFHLDGKETTYLKYFEDARVVCLPRFKSDIASTGISALLCSLTLGKCVLISKGPGAEDILTQGEAVFFEPENSDSLADALTNSWNNSALRKSISERGVAFSELVQGQERFLEDIVRALERDVR